MNQQDRDRANAEALARIVGADPVLVDVRPAGEVVPGMTPDTVLTSGAPLPWDAYSGPQRSAIIGGAIYEGLASDVAEAERRLADGTIVLSTCHEHDCVGSIAGIYTASMPVLVVENRTHGNTAFCNLFEGPSRKRLNYGSYDEEVHAGLRFLDEVIGPTLSTLLSVGGPVSLKPIMARALHMGDELHSRNTAATLLFGRELVPAAMAMEEPDQRAVAMQLLDFVKASDYFFLRLSMAAAKATINAAHGIPGSSVVTAMLLSCRDFAIRLSGTGETWFRGPLPDVQAELFDGYTMADNVFSGGESHHAELIGLGGFAQACAFGLQRFHGGTASEMARLNESMYHITVGENPDFHIPYFGYRGTPTGVDAVEVLATGIRPVIDGGLVGAAGVQIGAGNIFVPIECFEAAVAELQRMASAPPGTAT